MPGTYVTTENPTDNYVISASAPDTCPTLAPPPAVVVGGLSGGGLFLILFSIGVTVYAGGGTYYNIKYKQMPMPDAKQMDAFPHIVYWRELPGLVVDGCRFSWRHAKRAAKEAHDWYSGMSAPELKQGLTAAEEGDEPPKSNTNVDTKSSAPDF